MRLFKLISWMLLCGCALVAIAPAQAQQGTTRVAGRIIVARVSGTVTGTNTTNNTQRALVANDEITQNYIVTTGAGSSAILVFSNGASLNLGAESTLSIDEFLQDPFENEVALAELKEEPTTSVTKLNLSRGELVGNVKHLKQDQGSSFTVNTPVGAAGIRGTTFRIVFRPDASGRVFFTLSTAEGQILFEAPASQQQQVNVDTGKEVVVTVDVNVDTQTGTVTVTAPPSVSATQDIPKATQLVIAAAAQQIVEASSTAIIASVTQAAADQAAAEKAAAEKAAAEKAAAEKAAADKAAADKAAADKAAADKAAADKAAADQSKSDDTKTDDTKTGNTDSPPPFTPTDSNTPPPLPPSSKPTPGDGKAS